MSLSMQGKSVIVTGATSGIGWVTARELARKGARVILVGRSSAKLSTVAEQIKNQTSNPLVETICADLSTRAGVQFAAHEYKKRHTRLDVLVNNAGAIFMKREQNPDGVEMTFALNHLNYFHLTILLLDLLKATAPARIVNVSSDAHRGQVIDFKNLQGEKEYSGFSAYGRSKLMNLLFSMELSRRLQGTGVTVNALHPGFVASEFGKNNGKFVSLVMRVMSPIARSVEDGASTSIYLASSIEVEGVSGQYFTDKKPVIPDSAALNSVTAQRLWDISLEHIA